MNLQICYLKIDVSCEAYNPHLIQATVPSIFSTPHKMPRLPRNLHLVATWRSPGNAIQKNHETRLKCCACHATWRWTRPKCCACHENWNSSSENDAKVLRLPHKTIFDTLQNTSECQEAPRLPRKTQVRKSDPFCKTYHRRGHTALTRMVANGCERLQTVANGCGRLRAVADGWATSSEHTLNPQTPTVKREPLLRIREWRIKVHFDVLPP